MQLSLIEELQIAFRQKAKPLLGGLEPLTSYYTSGNQKEIAWGQKLLSSGKVGCIVLAGGQGTRLDWQGPKGTFPLTRFRHKSLFQLLWERKKAASKLYGQDLKIAVMTSPLNEEDTRRALPGVDIFSQSMAPFLDEAANPTDREGPTGNGDVLRHFVDSGLWQKWKEAGIEYVHLMPIDNPLADPFDPNLCGYHALSGADGTLKGILRERADEKVGVVGSHQGKIRVIEYFELPEEEREAFQGNQLKWRVSHITLFCFSMEFIYRAKDISLPWHFARKNNLFKCERFVFDLLDAMKTPRVIVYPRPETYAPLKNAMGENSPESVRAALLEFDRREWQRVTGRETQAVFELDPSFYYPTADLIAKWKGRLPDLQYIDP